MAEIIKATLEDLSDLVNMGRAFFYEAKWDKFYQWDDFSASSALTKLITNPNAIVLIARKDGAAIGMASALLYPLWYNDKILTGQEFFLYVEPERRKGIGHILKSQLEDEIKARGALTSIMGSVESMPALGEYYAKTGYELTERTYMKRLSW